MRETELRQSPEFGKVNKQYPRRQVKETFPLYKLTLLADLEFYSLEKFVVSG
jgi:hypothetical protein